MMHVMSLFLTIKKVIQLFPDLFSSLNFQGQ